MDPQLGILMLNFLTLEHGDDHSKIELMLLDIATSKGFPTIYGNMVCNSGIKMTNYVHVFLFVVLLSSLEPTPGDVKLYLEELVHWQNGEGEGQVIDMMSFGRIFPHGYPDKNTLNDAWDGYCKLIK
ncbi:hypothetical protein I3271_07380 [Photobacterium leiognathi]|uniref:hypothetical protein n=1 Tax=Photobacterium leiognathi TaxID=553611 RepID=UPI001EDE9F82|nr:hypothetical protein [Photobacterium leiognathi]MCG3884507.1 hypothetical protein [Photobacterium leiognathi]